MVSERKLSSEERQKFEGAKRVEIDKILKSKAIRFLSEEETATVAVEAAAYAAVGASSRRSAARSRR